jgi:hypothetical protein
MNKDKVIMFFIIIIGVSSMLGVMFFANLNINITALRRDAIESKAAYYHPETGKFTWKHKEATK